MCEPVTIAASIGAAAALGGAGLSAYGQYEAGKAQEQVARNNAIMARYQEVAAKGEGAAQAADILAQGRSAEASARTIIAGRGLTGGSTDSAVTTSAVNAARDAAQAKANAALQAWGFKNEAQDTLAQGRLARRASYLSAVGTGIQGLGQAASMGGQAYGAYKGG